jgi:putative ATP-binding cassette transporter
LSVVIIGAASVLYHARSRERIAGAREAAKWERQLIAGMTDILDGFKEIRLNSARSEALMDAVREVSRHAANVKIYAQSEGLKQLVFSQSAMYVLLAAIVFVVPTFSHSMAPGSVTKNTMAVLFVVGACFGVIHLLAMLPAADAAARHIEQLEEKLRATIMAATTAAPVRPSGFETIEMRDVVFRYPDRPSDPGFQIGPLNFTLKVGELVFVSGGNGSGKSTFMKLLAGLYSPAAGEIALDGAPIDDARKEPYRSLMTAVFPDYHLFHRLFGIPAPARAEIDELLWKFELENKTRVVNGVFSTLDLSDGQRKRLALLVGLLEKRPILLLDEWAANQDPRYRRRFYEQVLPELSRSGVTVVVVTHDDRYLDDLRLPARRLRMDEGRFV